MPNGQVIDIVLQEIEKWFEGDFIPRILPLVPLLGFCYSRVHDEWKEQIILWFKQLCELEVDDISAVAAHAGIVIMSSAVKISHLMTLYTQGLNLWEKGTSDNVRQLGSILMQHPW
jgi:hypothetical protein